MKTVLEANIQTGQKVLVRGDLDVPVKHNKILETYRLSASLDTLRYIISEGAVPVIAGHMGRPEGKVVPELSTKILTDFFNTYLGKDTYILLENLRFEKGEESNDKNYAVRLASNGTIYVNECFSSSHRKHASICGVTEILPSYAGLRLKKEVDTLNLLLESTKKPFVVVIGGVKLESKLPVVKKFLKIADYVLLGGKLAMEWKDEVPYNLVLPSDYATNQLDIGTNTIKEFENIISQAQTVLWSGPLGNFEHEEYSLGTSQIAVAITKRTTAGAFTVIGGGDTVAAVNTLSLLEKFSFVSTGGGAMLQYLADKTLPGIQALDSNRYA